MHIIIASDDIDLNEISLVISKKLEKKKINYRDEKELINFIVDRVRDKNISPGRFYLRNLAQKLVNRFPILADR